MIAWKCDFGYTTAAIKNTIGEILDKSSFIFTDFDRYLVFPVEKNPSIRPQIGNSVSYGKLNVDNRERFISFFEEWIGQDYYNIYGWNYNDNFDYTNALGYMKNTFPSFPLMFPNWVSLDKPVENAQGVVFRFNKLKKLLFCNRNRSTTAILEEVEGGYKLIYYSGGLYPQEGESYKSGVYGLNGVVHELIVYLGGPYNDVNSWIALGAGFTRVAGSNEYWLNKPKNLISGALGALANLFMKDGGNIPPDITGGEFPPDNPYEPGGPSGPTDPDLPPGTFDDESDPIPDSSLPTISAANTGFTRIYNPTLSQVQALARYLWTDETVIQTIWNHIKQFFENPMDAIIGFNLVPVPVPDGGTQNFALMYIDTGVSMTVAANQFVDMDCGTLKLERYYGSALDQSPYTKVSCFLPYIGTVNLNTDEVMGTTLQVKYRVDIVSGSCVAKIFVDGNCLYQYSGHCAITIPISSADFSSYVSAAISVGKLAAAAITAGAGTAMAAGVSEASQQTNQVVTTTQVTNTARNPSTGRQITTGTTTTVQTRESPADQSSTQASFSGLSPQNVANTVGAIMSSKPHIEHSGSFSGNSGYLGVRRPFLIIERPNMCMPANYQALNGFPAMITMELSTCKGFTRVQQVQLTGMGRATNPEQAEILELLKSGVIL